MKPNRCFALLLTASALAFLAHCTTSTGGGSGRSLYAATKDQPFVNSLGMKFVPVPGTKILMCTTETTVAQYQAAGMGYQAPKFAQGNSHPAVNVSWNDAKAWCAWLSKREGRKYRLTMDAEWSAAVGGSSYPWGNQWPPPNNVGNYCGQEFRTNEATELAKANGWKAGQLGVIGGFRDRHVFTAPVGSYAANGYGLHDLGGNVWEWCEDWHPDHHGIYRVSRGGSWMLFNRDHFGASFRFMDSPVYRGNFYGFRCVVEP